MRGFTRAKGRSTEFMPIAVLALGGFCAFTNIGLLSPLLPEMSRDLDVSEALAGQLATAGSFVTTVGSLVASPWMDRFSRRDWIRAEAAVLLVATIASALAPGFGWLLLARMLGAIGSAVLMANCLAGAGELITDQHRRAQAVGLIASATTMTLLIGLPVFAQINAFAGWRWAIAAYAVPLVLLIVGTHWLPANAPAGSGASTRFADGLRAVIARPDVGYTILATSTLILAYIGWLTYFGAFAEQELGVGAGTLGAYFLVAGIAELFANNLAAPLMRRTSPHAFAAACSAGFALALLLTGVVPHARWTGFAQAIAISVFSAMAYIGVSSWLIGAIPGRRGAVMALSSAATGLGSAAGTIAAGGALSLFGSYAAAYRLLGIAMVGGAVACVAAGRFARRTALAPAVP